MFPFLCLTSIFRSCLYSPGWRWAWSLSQNAQGTRQRTTWRKCQQTAWHTHTHSVGTLEKLIHLTVDLSGSKQEYSDITHTTCELDLCSQECVILYVIMCPLLYVFIRGGRGVTNVIGVAQIAQSVAWAPPSGRGAKQPAHLSLLSIHLSGCVSATGGQRRQHKAL